jgi:hypothetical protein
MDLSVIKIANDMWLLLDIKLSMKEFHMGLCLYTLIIFINVAKGNIFHPDHLHQVFQQRISFKQKTAREITTSEFEVFNPDSGRNY